MAGFRTFMWMDITPLRIHSSLMPIKVILLRLYNKLKFHILSRDGKMLGLSPSMVLKSEFCQSGHITFVL